MTVNMKRGRGSGVRRGADGPDAAGLGPGVEGDARRERPASQPRGLVEVEHRHDRPVGLEISKVNQHYQH